MILRNSVFTHSASATIGILAYVSFQRLKSSREKDNELETTSRMEMVAPKHSITLFRPNSNLQIAFDSRTKNTVYALERLMSTSLKDGGSTDRTTYASRVGKSFYEEKSISQEHRSRNGYYRNSGYDRGHMAASADFKYNDKAMNDTFSLSNVCPMVPLLNRHIWSRLEALCRKLAKQVEHEAKSLDFVENCDTYVVTGPLWLPSKIISPEQRNKDMHKRESFQFDYTGIGSPPHLIQVPTHFFKVIVTVAKIDGKEQIYKFAAFVLPNIQFENYHKINLKDYIVRIRDLESVSGISFFPNLWNSTTLAEIIGEYESKGKPDLINVKHSKEFADLLTDDIRSSINNERNTVSTDNDTQLQPYSVAISKSRQARNKSKIRQYHKILSGKTYIEHFCNKDACSEVIKLQKLNKSL